MELMLAISIVMVGVISLFQMKFPADIRVFMNNQEGNYDDFIIFNITEVQDQVLMKDSIIIWMVKWILLAA